MALTATATQRVRQDIVQQLAMKSPQTLVASFFRPNLHYSVEPKQGVRASILDFIRQHPHQSGIIYGQSRKKVESLYEFLKLHNINAGLYHAGLSDADRQANQEKFRQDEVEVMVATVAFGMGIDKSNIRFVIHQDAPQSLENFYQETGRAGRDGANSQCIMFFSSADMEQYRRFAQDLPQTERVVALQKLDTVQHFARSSNCRHQQLLAYFNEHWPHQQCQSCDNCLTPRPTFDATKVCQKILSCVYRLERPYSPTHISAILTGQTDSRITRFGHQHLSTFNIIDDYSPAQVRQLINELHSLGYLTIDSQNYNAVSLTPQSKAVLIGQATIRLSDLYAPGPRRVKRIMDTTTQPADVDQELFEVLRQVRLSIAKKTGLPPYVVFTDKSLQEMASQKPTDSTAFARIYGVGQQKIDKYGDAFIAAIKEYVQASNG